jgi:hypothetical protein
MAYVPSSTKDLKDVVHWPENPQPEERDVMISILDRLINEYESA